MFQVLAVGGDTKLGGDDFDHLLSMIILDKCRKKIGKDLSSRKHLFTISRSIKEHLCRTFLALLNSTLLVNCLNAKLQMKNSNRQSVL